MSVYEKIQLGIFVLLLVVFWGYTFYMMSYVFGARSQIDERLKRYAGYPEESSGVK
jgi:hypothetical protein